MIDTSKAILTEENTRIVDSCEVKSKEEMMDYLTQLRENTSPEMAINQRSVKSLVAEWRAHNLFYGLHVFRCRTHDVDLERHQSWWREAFCRVVSFFYFW
ncbi:MAG: hypothetical protein MJZ91_02855 [Bacteroidales bacterium]|nr:hypothetical protein [Bacteroidales bacterium]